MKALRLDDALEKSPLHISTDFSHIDHMYTGPLSGYYYARFDQALEAVQPDPTDRVLEIGGGTGLFILTVSQLVGEVHFSDISREAPLFLTPRHLFESAEIDDSSVSYAAADTTSLPYATNTFDLVFVLDVLEHVPDERTAISEISRVTKSSGDVVISAPIEVGPALLYREVYRYVDGKRNESESISEVARGIFGSTRLKSNEGHRNYDYRRTVDMLLMEFENVEVGYCPVPLVKWLNPTANVTAKSPTGGR